MLLRVLSISLILILSACAGHKPLNDVGSLDHYQRELNKIVDWQLKGRINVRVPGDSETVRVTWNNEDSKYRIDLRGTLGLGATRIMGAPGLVRMEQSGEPPVVARSAEELIYTQFGREIPISDLHYWIRGLPAPQPQPDQVTHTDLGMLAMLDQSGWSLQYDEYMAVGDWNMPKKIVAVRDDFRLTLLVSEWTLDNKP